MLTLGLIAGAFIAGLVSGRLHGRRRTREDLARLGALLTGPDAPQFERAPDGAAISTSGLTPPF